MSHLKMGASLLDIIAYPPDADAVPASGALDHYCVSVSPFDAEAIIAHLVKHSLEPSPLKNRYGAYGTGPSIYFKDCEGNTVEVKGKPDE